jgi:cytidylate kinase
MNPAIVLERQVEALERAQRHWQERHGEGAGRAARAFTIALGRAAGTPGTSVAREVGARLGWPVYDNELLQRIAGEMGLRTSLLESVDERRQNWLLQCVEAFPQQTGVTEGAFLRHLVQTVLSLGAHGQCLIVGRGASLLLPPESTLRVRLVAPLEDRIEAASRRLELSRPDAARWVEQTERERVRFAKDHFQKDPSDPALYDLVLNTARWSVAECADFIIEGLRRLETRAT